VSGTILLHASCVALNGRGLLITGPSGSGKSSLALQLMALGADLIADDQTEVSHDGTALVARCPATLRGLIEARGVGILRADPADRAVVTLVADLSQLETDRLPPRRRVTILGCEVDLVLRVQDHHFHQAVMLYLARGRHA